MGYVAEMELKTLKKKTAEGRAVAKSRGAKFGRKKTYTSPGGRGAEEEVRRGGLRDYRQVSGNVLFMVQRIVKDQVEVA